GNAEFRPRSLCLFDVQVRNPCARIYKQCNARKIGHNLFEIFESLCTQLDRKVTQPGRVAAWTLNALHEFAAERIRHIHENDWHTCRRLDGVWCGAADRDNRVGVHRRELGSHACEQLRLLGGKPMLKSDLSVAVPEAAKALDQ